MPLTNNAKYTAEATALGITLGDKQQISSEIQPYIAGRGSSSGKWPYKKGKDSYAVSYEKKSNGDIVLTGIEKVKGTGV